MGVEITACEIPDVLELTSSIFEDDRGYFTEFHNQSAMAASGFDYSFVQDNLSKSSRGVLRGLHYQLEPNGQGKLVRCIQGKIFDVAVDIRSGSPTFGQWVGRELDADKGNALWVPIGFAHGFLALTDDTFVMYKCTGPWVAEAERTIRYDDPSIGIKWPFSPTLVNQKDLDAPGVDGAEKNFSI